MNERNSRWPALVGLAALLLFGAAADAKQPNDAWITTKVKVRLLRADGVHGRAVDVDTRDGLVTLHGAVASPAERMRAGEWTEEVGGVRGVRNLLAVVREAERERVAAEDADLRQRLEQALAGDPELGASSIEIVSIHHGNVVLAGAAESLSAHRRALEIARDVDGVLRVASDIHSPDKLGDAEIWWNSDVARDEPDSSLRLAASDAWVTTKAKLRLTQQPAGLSLTDVQVDTNDGVVKIFGVVETQEAKELAGQRLLELKGVRYVENQLQVLPDAAQESPVSDDTLRELVRARLQERETLSDASIEVDVDHGFVRLRGSVDDPVDRLTALTVARTTGGVRSVVDDLAIAPRS
jgi:hyperosmotically inducible protein